MAEALICGVDEAGRGPLAGPVYAAAVVLDATRPIAGLADSKKLSEKRRMALAESIRTRALAWAVAFATVEEIDRLNILRASLLAMRRAVGRLSLTPTEVLVDGLHCPEIDQRVRAIIGGDATVAAISAASILAKTGRDAEMLRLHDRFPLYGFDRHKGYPTPEHLDALRRHGVCEIHRRTFAPVRRMISGVL
ncbi:MAG: ribonuclease HII [Betaproteobacteria bacterium RIFCSPLOWO2_12_FULL_65_110]|nr:MAG: ribonuclease HII [Betaproteobacteria bacterium RIFCSPLOWO2_02_FULL_65_20]OGA41829.1 MAG: ribonuclease HII [Betaproteobacteria bacterium RIFCSPLOWO2_12_FULL_65_110]